MPFCFLALRSVSLITVLHLHSCPSVTKCENTGQKQINNHHSAEDQTIIELCDPLNCAEEGLRNNCWSTQLSAVWRPQGAKFLRLNLSFLQQQEVGYGSERLWRACLCCSFWICLNHKSSRHRTVIDVTLMTAVYHLLASFGHSGKVRARLQKGEIAEVLSWVDRHRI